MVVGSDEYDRTDSESHRRLATTPMLEIWDRDSRGLHSSGKFPEYTVMKIIEVPNCLERDSPFLSCGVMT